MTIDAALRALVREEIRSVIREELAALAPTTAPEWLPARSCGLRPTTRRRLTREGILPTSKIGRELMVRRADVEKYIASQALPVREGDELDELLARRGTH